MNRWQPFCCWLCVIIIVRFYLLYRFDKSPVFRVGNSANKVYYYYINSVVCARPVPFFRWFMNCGLRLFRSCCQRESIRTEWASNHSSNIDLLTKKVRECRNRFRFRLLCPITIILLWSISAVFHGLSGGKSRTQRKFSIFFSSSFTWNCK